MIPEAKTDFWIENNYNVLMKAKHGVGKTSIILNAFKKHGLKYVYFSGATMDPWVDFVGVPKEYTDENGVTYLDLVRPKPFAYDDVEAIFIDEMNRSPSKVRNALMELIQFKSINGKKFNNLRMVWAAVNPPGDDDDDVKYQTEDFDPAQEDRFHVILDLPYKPHPQYFIGKFGKDMTSIAVKWWNDLSNEQKNKLSPRRLDLGLEFFIKGGDLRDVFDKTINVSSLVDQLNSGSYIDTFNDLISNLNTDSHDDALESIEKFLSKPNHINAVIKSLSTNKKLVREIAPVLKDEVLFKILSNTALLNSFVEQCYYKRDKSVLDKIYNNNDTYNRLTTRNKKIIDNGKAEERKELLEKLTPEESLLIAIMDSNMSMLGNTVYRIKALNTLFSHTYSGKQNDIFIEEVRAIYYTIAKSFQLNTFKNNVSAFKKLPFTKAILFNDDGTYAWDQPNYTNRSWTLLSKKEQQKLQEFSDFFK